MVYGGAPVLLFALIMVWGFAVVADSAQFSALVSEHAPRDHVGTALTLQTCVGFLLTMVTIELLPRVADYMRLAVGIALARTWTVARRVGHVTAGSATDEVTLAMQIPFSKRTLSNGLDVIVHEDHQLPMVAVNVWYHVGSKNEQPGRTGFAHLFEHLMFEGSEHHDHGYFPPLQRAGGLLNGSTSTDRTNYWEVVPTGALDLALWMESDRMGYLLPALTDAEVQQPARCRDRTSAARITRTGRMALPASRCRRRCLRPTIRITGRPSARPPISRAASLDHVRDFFQTYYHPGERVAVAGRRSRNRRRRSSWPSNISATCAPGPAVQPCQRAGRALTDSATLLLEDRVELPRVYLSWHSPAMFAPTTRSSMWRRTCSRTARRRGSTRRWSTSAASPPTCPRISIRAK